MIETNGPGGAENMLVHLATGLRRSGIDDHGPRRLHRQPGRSRLLELGRVGEKHHRGFRQPDPIGEGVERQQLHLGNQELGKGPVVLARFGIKDV